jgi:hypothetical protein
MNKSATITTEDAVRGKQGANPLGELLIPGRPQTKMHSASGYSYSLHLQRCIRQFMAKTEPFTQAIDLTLKFYFLRDKLLEGFNAIPRIDKTELVINALAGELWANTQQQLMSVSAYRIVLPKEKLLEELGARCEGGALLVRWEDASS